jgi:hypothetical protein
MQPRTQTVAPLCLIVLLATGPTSGAESWTATLEGGEQVRVDPNTNRATVTTDGQEVQLWNGVHKLQNGQELTVESGRVVPNQQILQTREPWPRPALPATGGGEPIVDRSPCEKLVRKACGADDACADSRACGPARQLLDMEHEEQRQAGTPKRTTFTSGKCDEALGDAFFARCTPRGASAP